MGLTLSLAQREHAQSALQGRAEIRLEAWQDHEPEARYDGVLSFGAFEHFARDGSRSAERVLAYRRFFAACHRGLVPRGRLGLETIAHDDAPDTAAPKGRGPLGDSVLDLFPESLAPHLAEIVLGFEPWFRLELLRSDAARLRRAPSGRGHFGCAGRRPGPRSWWVQTRRGGTCATSPPARCSSASVR